MALSQGMLGARTGHPSTFAPAGPARPPEALTAAPGAWSLALTPTHAQRTRVQRPVLLVPVGPLAHGTAATSCSWCGAQCLKVSLRTMARERHWGGTIAVCPAARLSSPWVNQGGFSRDIR